MHALKRKQKYTLVTTCVDNYLKTILEHSYGSLINVIGVVYDERIIKTLLYTYEQKLTITVQQAPRKLRKALKLNLLKILP